MRQKDIGPTVCTFYLFNFCNITFIDNRRIMYFFLLIEKVVKLWKIFYFASTVKYIQILFLSIFTQVLNENLNKINIKFNLYLMKHLRIEMSYKEIVTNI